MLQILSHITRRPSRTASQGPQPHSRGRNRGTASRGAGGPIYGKGSGIRAVPGAKARTTLPAAGPVRSRNHALPAWNAVCKTASHRHRGDALNPGSGGGQDPHHRPLVRQTRGALLAVRCGIHLGCRILTPPLAKGLDWRRHLVLGRPAITGLTPLRLGCGRQPAVPAIVVPERRRHGAGCLPWAAAGLVLAAQERRPPA